MSKETYTLTWSPKHHAFKVDRKNIYLRTERDEETNEFVCTASHDFAGACIYYGAGKTPEAAIRELLNYDELKKGGLL